MVFNRYSLTELGIAQNLQLSRLLGHRQETCAKRCMAGESYLTYTVGLHSDTALMLDRASTHSHLMSFLNREDPFRNLCLLSYHNLRTLSQEAWHRFLKLSAHHLQPSKFQFSLQLPCVITAQGRMTV